MSVISSILTIWVLLILFFSFVKPKYAVGLYLAHLILVPYLKINLGSIELQYNFVNLIILAGFLFNFRHKKVNIKPLIPFLFYFIAILLVMPFQTMSLQTMLHEWRADFMKFLILPFIMFNLISEEPKLIKHYCNIVLGSLVVVAVYGLVLTQMPGTNPYVMYLSLQNGVDFNEAYALGFGGMAENIDYKADTGRAFGRISSVFTHPMTFGLFLILGFVFLLEEFRKKKRVIVSICLVLLLTNIFTCGVRSAIGALAVVVFYILISYRSVPLLTFSAVAAILGYQILLQIMPDFNNYLLSMFDMGESEIGGSSMDMRWEQLQGCFAEVKDIPVFGHGYGWTWNYLRANTIHPIILAFESLIYVVICNEGIYFGLSLWTVFLFLLIKNIHSLSYWKHRTLLTTLTIGYITYATVTGDYGYMQYFILFYVLMYAQFHSEQAIQ